MKKCLSLVLGFAMVFSMTTLTQAQIDIPQPSPLAKVNQAFGLGEVTIEYSRPSVKGRAIFGTLVPYGKIWRTGANASTKVEFTDDVTINGNAVPKGKYALYTIPNKDSWTVIIHKNLTYWGSGDDKYKIEEDQVRFNVKPEMLTGKKVETFTISVENITQNTCDIVIAWDNVRVPMNVSTDIDARITAQIQKVMNPEPSYRPYYDAATYYLQANKDLDQALVWATEAAALRDAFWVVHLKAKVEKANGQYAKAIETAKLSMEKAKEANNMDYVALNEKLIEECKKAK